MTIMLQQTSINAEWCRSVVYVSMVGVRGGVDYRRLSVGGEEGFTPC